MLTTWSKIKFTRNKENPRNNPLTSSSNGVKRIPTPKQDKARSKSTFLYDGSINNDE
jgi:hypothetical protein